MDGANPVRFLVQIPTYGWFSCGFVKEEGIIADTQHNAGSLLYRYDSGTRNMFEDVTMGFLGG
jgi:hypothetical protein